MNQPNHEQQKQLERYDKPADEPPCPKCGSTHTNSPYWPGEYRGCYACGHSWQKRSNAEDDKPMPASEHNHLMDYVLDLHIIIGPNGKCRCGEDGITCLERLRRDCYAVGSAILGAHMIKDNGGKKFYPFPSSEPGCQYCNMPNGIHDIRCPELRVGELLRQVEELKKVRNPNGTAATILDQQQQIDQLRAENSELVLKVAAKPTWDDVNKEIARTNKFIAENAEFRKDKERLDWLEKNGMAIHCCKSSLLVWSQIDATRQAIDAAREHSL